MLSIKPGPSQVLAKLHNNYIAATREEDAPVPSKQLSMTCGFPSEIQTNRHTAQKLLTQVGADPCMEGFFSNPSVERDPKACLERLDAFSGLRLLPKPAHNRVAPALCAWIHRRLERARYMSIKALPSVFEVPGPLGVQLTRRRETNRKENL